MLSVLAQKRLHSKDQYWLLREMEQTYENFSHVKIDFLINDICLMLAYDLVAYLLVFVTCWHPT